jgi:EAL domain-containing protein (putative c-di-GMP-specific phosphodiesterase class I)
VTPCAPACDCAAPSASAPLGVRLLPESAHVRAQTVAIAGELTLDGSRWDERLAELLAALTATERARLLAVPLGHTFSLAVPAERLLARARAPWLPEVLARRAVVPHFEPVADLGDGRVVAQVAQVRAVVGDRTVTAAELLAAAAAYDALFQLDELARAAALEAAPVLPADQLLFVNLLTGAIYDPAACLRSTWTAARRGGADVRRVAFQIIGGEAFGDLDFLTGIADACRAAGALVSLDGLGAGAAGLTLLRRVRPAFAWLDEALVRGLDGDPARARLLAAFVAEAHELGVRVVCEGIETAGELEAAHAIGADLGHGRLLAPPAPAPAIDRSLLALAA